MHNIVLKYVFGFGIFLLSFTAFAQDIEQGRDYVVLPHNPSTQRLQDIHQVKVIEFFSYGCPACFKLEPHLEKWLSHKPHDVLFERIPVLFQPDWLAYAKNYIALEELHMHDSLNKAIFTAVQSQNLNLGDANIMADFVASHGIDRNTFLQTVDAPSTQVRLAENKKITQDYMVFQVPTIIIDGKYKVDPSFAGSNYHRMFVIVNYLVKKEKHLKNITK